jgi:phosphoribosylaminoimidazolecarboxamide formyltransferase/IMP cyclohydrolase
MSGDSGRKPIRRALISVYDKTGLEELASGLHEAGVAIVSTGSTAKTIAGVGVPVTPVEELTGFPEVLDGQSSTVESRRCIHACTRDCLPICASPSTPPRSSNSASRRSIS